MNRRVMVVCGLIMAVLAGAIVDRLPLSAVTDPAMPVSQVAPAAATSSAWYCPMVSAAKTDAEPGAVEIANLGETPLFGTATIAPGVAAPLSPEADVSTAPLTTVPVTATPVTTPVSLSPAMTSTTSTTTPVPTPEAPVVAAPVSVDVPIGVSPHTRATVRPGEVVNSAYAGVLIRLDGGEVAVEHSVVGPQGESWTPCASSASDHWYVADGTTDAGAATYFGLFNPFAEDAVVDMSFLTSDGPAEPSDFQGVVVPARSMVWASVGDRLRRRDWLSASIIAKAGRIVVDQLQTGTFNSLPGTALTLAVPGPANSWFFADGGATAGLTDRLALYNPDASNEADVSVSVIPDQGQVLPFALVVPATGRVAVNFDAQDRIPKDMRYSVVVRVTNNIAVVAVRVATAASGAVAGSELQTGVTAAANRWILVAGSTIAPASESVSLMNPGARIATVRLSVISDGTVISVDGGQQVDPGQRLNVHLNDRVPPGNYSVLIESDQPVVSARELLAGTQNLSAATAIPLR